LHDFIIYPAGNGMHRRHSFTTILSGILFVVLLATAAEAQTPLRRPFGFGFSLGDPTGVTVKFRTGRSSAIDIGVGKGVIGYPRVHADYLWQFLNLFQSPRMSPYAGVGFVAGFGDKGTSFLFSGNTDSTNWYYTKNVSLAGRGVIGFSYFPIWSPIEIFGELNPIIGFAPKAAFSMEAAVGVRFYLAVGR
jgi:hypothetical protein